MSSLVNSHTLLGGCASYERSTSSSFEEITEYGLQLPRLDFETIIECWLDEITKFETHGDGFTCHEVSKIIQITSRATGADDPQPDHQEVQISELQSSYSPDDSGFASDEDMPPDSNSQRILPFMSSKIGAKYTTSAFSGTSKATNARAARDVKLSFAIDVGVIDGDPDLAAAKSLLTDLWKYADGQGLVATSLKGQFSEEAMLKDFGDDFFVDDTEQIKLGITPAVDKVLVHQSHQMIRFQAWQQSANHDMDWYLETNRAISTLAFYTSIHSSKLRLDKKTSADFIAFARSNKLDDALLATEPLPDRARSWNPWPKATPHEYPIAITIAYNEGAGETKKTQARLKTWITNQYQVMEKLFETTAVDQGQTNRTSSEKEASTSRKMPILPLILVDDHHWSLYAGTGDSKDNKLWQLGDVGKSYTVKGIYQIASVLHRLMEWAQKDYRLWFEKHLVEKYLLKSSLNASIDGSFDGLIASSSAN